MTIPVNLPSSLRTGFTWVMIGYVFASWVGWMEAPWQRAAEQRDEWAQAYATAVARIEQQDRSLNGLQIRDERTQKDLDAIRLKLDEMAMVLYSLERRTR